MSDAVMITFMICMTIIGICLIGVIASKRK